MKIKMFTYFMLVLLITTQMSAQWSNVGSAGFSDGTVSYTSIAIGHL